MKRSSAAISKRPGGRRNSALTMHAPLSNDESASKPPSNPGSGQAAPPTPGSGPPPPQSGTAAEAAPQAPGSRLAQMDSAFLWIDVFSTSPGANPGARPQQPWFDSGYASALRRACNCIVVLDRWDSPTCLSRLWCATSPRGHPAQPAKQNA